MTRMVEYEYEVPWGALNLSSTKLPRPWSPWKYSLSRKNPHGRIGNLTRDLMISIARYLVCIWSGEVPTHALKTACVCLRSVYNECHFTRGKKYLSVFIWASMRALFLRLIHACSINCICFFCNPSIIKATLLGERSTFLSLSGLPWDLSTHAL
jgi:hypothetical protein